MPNSTTEEECVVAREDVRPVAGCSANEDAIKNASLAGMLRYIHSARAPYFLRIDIGNWVTSIHSKFELNDYIKNVSSDEAVINVQISYRNVPNYNICIIGVNIQRVNDSYEPIEGSVTVDRF